MFTTTFYERAQEKEAFYDLNKSLQILEKIFHNLPGMTRPQRIAIHSTLQHMGHIVREPSISTGNVGYPFSVNDLLEEIIGECNYYQQNVAIRLSSPLKNTTSLTIPREILKRALTNCLHSLIESNPKNDVIKIYLQENSNYLSLKIKKKKYPSTSPNFDLVYAQKIIRYWGGEVTSINTQAKTNILHIFLPRNIVNNSPMPLKQTIDAVLVDKDTLVHFLWEKAAKRNRKRLACHSDLERFLESSAEIPLDTPIYIDVNMGRGIRGDSLTMHLYNLGFKNIFLTSSSGSERLMPLPWLKRVVGKAPPWPLSKP